MTADTLIKFQDKSAECKAGGHQCDFIGQMVSKLMSDVDKDLKQVFHEVKIETAAKSALGGLKDLKLASADAGTSIPKAITGGGIQV